MKLPSRDQAEPHRVAGEDHRYRANVFAAWVTSAGGGLVATVMFWLVGSRLVAFVLDAPAGPVVALLGAFITGTIVTVKLGIRLHYTAIRELSPEPADRRNSATREDMQEPIR